MVSGAPDGASLGCLHTLLLEGEGADECAVVVKRPSVGRLPVVLVFVACQLDAQGGAVAEGDDAPGARLSGYGLGNGDCCKQDYQDDISCFH